MNKKRISIITLIVGLVVLAVGVAFLIIRLTASPGIADGEYLVSIGKWKLQGEGCEQLKCGEDTKCANSAGETTTVCANDGVVWNFTEVGKGTLTTNNHVNDYDFVWALEDGKLKIETEWLYTMDNTYEYSLDQGANILTLTSGAETITFAPAE